MDILKELKKQTEDILKNAEKKEKVGDALEGALGQVKKNVKDDKTKKMIDNVIKSVDKATTNKNKKK